MNSIIKGWIVLIGIMLLSIISVSALENNNDYPIYYEQPSETTTETETQNITETTSFFETEPLEKPTEPTEGFIVINNKTYYYKNNMPLCSEWIKENNIKYHTNEKGEIIKNKIITINNNSFFFNKKGELQKNKWILYNNKKYYSKANGVLYKNRLFKINNKKYCASVNNYIYTNRFFKYKKNKYYAAASGQIVEGKAFKVNKKTYIAKSNGIIICSKLVSYNSIKCIAGKSGALVKNGKITINKTKYFTTNNYSIRKVIIDAPIISQLPNLPTGCELVSTTMLISYQNNKIYKNTEFYNEIKKYVSPYLGYNGDCKQDGNIYCFPDAVAPLINKYIGYSLRINNIHNIKKQIINGKPVVCWMNNLSGFGLHCVLVTGYDNNSFYYNDPWFSPSHKNASQNKNKRISNSAFATKFYDMGANAISYN